MASFEFLFLTLVLLISGYPFELLQWVVDPWPLCILFVLILGGFQLKLGRPKAVFGREPVLVGALVLLVFLFILSGRGSLISGDWWIWIWLITSGHWLLLSRDSDVSHHLLDRASFVPLTLLPVVLSSLASLEASTSGSFCLLILVGALLSYAVKGVRNEILLFRHFGRYVPGWLYLSLPLIAVLAQFLSYGTEKSALVLIDEFHHSTAGSTIDLKAGDRAAESAPGHGQFVKFLEDSGYKAVRSGEAFTAEKLKDVSIVALLMNSSPLSFQERQVLAAFVKNGGGLLVVGDHTDVEGTSSAMNPLLSIFGVELNFDTVWRRLDMGRPDVSYLAHPLTCHQERIYFSTGCSLALSCCSPLRPFIVTNSALFGDLGDYNGNAYLGDSKLGPGEKMGSLVLAAAGSYGRGRVVVLGDSAYFQNGVMLLNEGFASRVLAWLNRAEIISEAAFVSYLLSFGASLLLLLIILIRRSQLQLVLPLLVFGVAISAVISCQVGNLPTRTPVKQEKTMVLDLAHGNKCHFFWNTTAADMAYDSMDIWLREMKARDWNIDLHESGLLSRSILKNAQLLTVIHPRQRYDESELAAIEGFLQQGGDLLLFVGPESGGGREALLPFLGFVAEKHPLGFHAPKMYAKEFPLEVFYGDGPWPEASVDKQSPLLKNQNLIPVAPVEVSGGTTVARALGKSFIVYGTRFRGRIILFGDRLHFSDYAFIDGQGLVDSSRLAVLSSVLEFIGRPRK